MITRALALVAFLAALALLLAATAQAAPNILVVLSDDHGWADLGAHGVDTDVQTPHIDQLAAEGALMVRGYVTAPQCIPSRVAIITGGYQQKHGIEDNDDENVLDNTIVSLADRLAGVGYVTGIVGKWHIGDSIGYLPPDFGFAETCYQRSADYMCYQEPDGTPLAGTDRIKYSAPSVTTDITEALYFLNRRAASPETPWFLFVAHKSPHIPATAYEPWYSTTFAGVADDTRRKALSSIAAMDDGLDQLRDAIAAMGQTENTIVFFVGDNGAQLDANLNGSLNTPLIGKKGMLTDGGIREPYVAAWPGHWRPGRVVASPVSSLDIAATAVAAAGITDTTGLDGIDLTPYLGGCLAGAAYPWAPCARDPGQTLYWRWNEQAAVLRWPWKFIQIGSDAGTHYQMLFDLSVPENEQYQKDKLAVRPRVVETLKARLDAWAATLTTPGLIAPPNEGYIDIYRDYGVLPPAP